MVSSEIIQVTLTGGAPWGFRLSGGGALPLTIDKIRNKSRAQALGLLEGDVVVSINGVPVLEKTQDEALYLMETSEEKLALQIFRGDVDELSYIKPKKSSQVLGASNSGLIVTAKSNKQASPRYPYSVNSKPSQTMSSTTMATFDDGQTRREVAREQHLTIGQDGRSSSVVQRETTSMTSSSKRRGPPFVKSHTSAFNDHPKTNSSVHTAERNSSSSSTQKSNSLNQQGQASSFSSIPSASSNYLQPWQQPSAISSSFTMNNVGQGSLGPVFKPSKFVPGSNKRDFAGLYASDSPATVDLNVSAMFRDGKENMVPASPSMFEVKHIVPETSKGRSRDIWRPNVWLPEERPDLHTAVHSRVTPPRDDSSCYNTVLVTSVKPAVSLVEQQRKKLFQSQMSKNDYDMNNEDVNLRPQLSHDQHHGLHVFAPPVQIDARDSNHDTPNHDGEDEAYYYEECYEEPPFSSESAAINTNKKMYSDSAFYNTPGQSYPTIGEQMKLCKIIAQSLTSAANKRARGAKMFMRRKRKSSKWVHESHIELFSSAGDVANLYELDSELSTDEGGNKPLMYFKIPSMRNRKSSEGKQTNMALNQEQFERLRLNAQKCEHTTVLPDTCFDIAADLKAHKGRGGRMFEKLSDKFVVDNAQYRVQQSELKNVSSQPIRQEKTPLMAATEYGGNVDFTSCHISESERNKKLNQLFKSYPPRKLEMTHLPHGVQSEASSSAMHNSLKSDGGTTLNKGKNFNRTAIGWGGCEEYTVAERVHHISPTRELGPNQASTLSQNYNNAKTWQRPRESANVSHPGPEPHQNQWDQRRQDDWQNRRQYDKQSHLWAESGYDPFRVGRQEVTKPCPKSCQGGGNNKKYTDEYQDNKYGHFDNRTAPRDYPLAAYMQPIIPGTDV